MRRLRVAFNAVDLALYKRVRSLAHTPETVRWVDNQNSRWGSCTPSDRSIRLSTRLQGMPAWVIDYVLVHELAHLIEAGHTPAFWAWVDRYPKAERAKGFLEGVACATQLGLQAEPPDCSEEGAAAMLATDGSDVEAEES